MGKLTWELIMENSPTMRGIIEGKITEEIAQKDVEIQELKEQNTALQGEIDALALRILTYRRNE